MNLRDFTFISDDHTRLEQGIPTAANNKGAMRGIRIQSSDNQVFSVTMHNFTGDHPIWHNTIQMAPKQMKIIKENEDIIELRGFGRDSMGAPFSDYGVTLHKKSEDIDQVTLHLHDRHVDIVYHKQADTRETVEAINNESKSEESTVDTAITQTTSTPAGQKPLFTQKRFSLLQTLALVLILAVASTYCYHLYISNSSSSCSTSRDSDKEAYGVQIPSGYSIVGLDFSHHQKTIDWKKLRQVQACTHPARFVFLKATEGSTYVDDCYSSNMKNARREGYVCGAYLYFRNSSSGVAQAKHYIQTAKLQAGDMAPIVDIEEKPGKIPLKKWRKQIQDCLDVLEKEYGQKPILYSVAGFKNGYLNTSQFNKYPLWVGHYRVKQPRVSAPWRFWQFTQRGRVPGIVKHVDVNVMKGSLADFNGMRIQ